MNASMHDPNWAEVRKTEKVNYISIGKVEENRTVPSTTVDFYYNDKDIKTVQGTVKLSEILLEVSRAINEGTFYLQEDLILSMQSKIESLEEIIEQLRGDI